MCGDFSLPTVPPLSPLSPQRGHTVVFEGCLKADLVRECIKDIRGCFEAGARRVSTDFTEARLAVKNDVRVPWTCRGLLPTFLALIDEVLMAFDAQERRNIGIRSCAGADCDSTHSADVPLEGLISALFGLDAGYFLIGMLSEPKGNRRSVFKSMAINLRDHARGVKQVVFIGVTNPCRPEIETAEEVKGILVEAAEFIDK